MEYDIKIRGLAPGLLMHNGAAGLDTRSPQKLEMATISAKRGNNRTAADEERLAELECQISLYVDHDGNPTLPAAMIRACIEQAARKLKQGPMVREGLIISEIRSFDYDREQRGATVDELGRKAQHRVPVVVQRNRIIRTRAHFPEWELSFYADADDELIHRENLAQWLTIAGRRIGLGDWRPAKSGEFGRFEILEMSQAMEL